MNLKELKREKQTKVFLLKSFEAIKVLTKFLFFNRFSMIHNYIHGSQYPATSTSFISFNIVEEKKRRSKSKLAIIVTIPAVFTTIVLIAVVVVIFR